MQTATNQITLFTKAKLFRGFSDSSRLSILETLLEGPKTVGDIVLATGLSQPNASSHLSCLRECGLVNAQQQGRFVKYQLSDERINKILNLTSALLADVAKGVYECTRYISDKELSNNLPKEPNNG